MAAAARRVEAEAHEYMPVTRVYAQPRRSAVQKPYEDPAQRKLREQELAQARAAARVEARKRAFMLLAIAVAATCILMMIVRYCLITQQYAQVNEAKTDIARYKREVQEYNVQLNSVLTLSEAREAAEEAGLGYPSAGQIIEINPQER